MASMTTKKLKVVGTQKFKNVTTGTIEEFQVMNIEEKDANFQKIWLGHIMHAIEELSNAKMKVVMHLLHESRRLDNIIISSNQKLADTLGISRKTVSEVINALEKNDVICRPQKCVIMMNPDVIFKGSMGKRMNLLLRYGEGKQLDLFDNVRDLEEKRKADIEKKETKAEEKEAKAKFKFGNEIARG
jgi:DNA-binding Lrp family transcriptional regulator